jgi:hypothetical protein
VIRHSIKTIGLKVGRVSRGQFEARVRELVAGDPLIAGLTDCMLRARAALWQEYVTPRCPPRPTRAGGVFGHLLFEHGRTDRILLAQAQA